MNGFKEDLKKFLDNISTMNYYKEARDPGVYHLTEPIAASGKNTVPQIIIWCSLSETDCWVDGSQISANVAFLGFSRHKSHVEVLLKQSC